MKIQFTLFSTVLNKCQNVVLCFFSSKDCHFLSTVIFQRNVQSVQKLLILIFLASTFFEQNAKNKLASLV